MDQTIETVLKEYEERATAEDAVIASLDGRKEMLEQRDRFLLAVGRHTGTLLNIFVRDSGATRVLEIGTSYGYSTVWLADAVRATGGRVTTLELVAEKQQHARAQLTRAGLERFVDFKLGEARDTLAALPGPFDFVLIDLWKDLYIPCFDLIYPKLSPGAILVADNMIEPEVTRAEARKYQAHVRGFADIDSVLLPVGSGIEVSRKGSR
jgi:predicted O-methyltransferase YrrM